MEVIIGAACFSALGYYSYLMYNYFKHRKWQFVLVWVRPPLSQNQRRLVKVIQSIQYLHRQVAIKERKNIGVKVGEHTHY